MVRLRAEGVVGMPLDAALIALAALAGNTVVTAAVTDAWESARKGFARLLGRGDPDEDQLAEERLEETHDQLAEAGGADLEQARAALAAQWVTRLADLLEEDPGAEADLRALVQEIQAQLPAGMVSAADHSVAAGRDVNISAIGGGMAAGVIHGNVAPPDPTRPGPAGELAGPGRSGPVGPGSVFADRGGTAIGQVVQPRARRWRASRCGWRPGRRCWPGGRICSPSWIPG